MIEETGRSYDIQHKKKTRNRRRRRRRKRRNRRRNLRKGKIYSQGP